MNLSKSFFALSLTVSLVFVSFLSSAVQSVSAQDINIAVQRGYRTGYSDGYMSGYRDTIEKATKSYEKHDEYKRADRAFHKEYGTLEDYRDGYQQGFESGYDTGFEKRSFDAAVPAALVKRSVTPSELAVETPTAKAAVEEKSPVTPIVETPVAAQVEQPVSSNTATEPIAVSQPTTNNQPTVVSQPDANTEVTRLHVINTKQDYINTVPSNSETLVIPVETELIVELLDDVNTERNREGDKFQARIISPNEFNGAILEGRISKIQKPGRIKRRAEVLLSFDRIVLPGNRWSNFNAVLTEVLPIKGDNVKRVDIEGTIEGRSSVKSDSIKVGAATGTGLVIGAVAGGPVGAAVGAGVGAAFGVGGVVIERGRHIRLDKNQQLRIKTAYETQIR